MAEDFPQGREPWTTAAASCGNYLRDIVTLWLPVWNYTLPPPIYSTLEGGGGGFATALFVYSITEWKYFIHEYLNHANMSRENAFINYPS